MCLTSSFSSLSSLFLSVVVFVADFYIAREGMLHAYDEDMINGDFVFIIFELDQTQVSLYTEQPFKWFFSSYPRTLNRYHHVKAAFEAAFVLAIKSPSSRSYANFTEQVKRRSPEEPFNSTVYQGYLWKKNSKFPANKTKVKCKTCRSRGILFHVHISSFALRMRGSFNELCLSKIMYITPH